MDIDKIIDATKNVSNIAPQAYSDIVQPPAQNIGKSLATVTALLNTALTPIEIINETVSIQKEKFLDEYKKNLENIPPEKVSPSNFAVIAPMIDHLKFKITENELREKYAKLLSHASNADSLVKPLLSFDNVLDQLSPYEVTLLGQLFSQLPDQNYPLASIKITNDDGWQFPYKNFPGISFNNLPFETISVMISNFKRLGIINIDYYQYVVPVAERYAYVTNSPLFLALKAECDNLRKTTNLPYPECVIEKHSFNLTEFGKSFVTTVII